MSQMSTFLTHSIRALVITCLFAWSTGLSAQIAVGEPPPDEIGTAEGEPVLLSNQTGIVQVVTFWASWCPPCRKELPVLAQIQKQVGTDQLQIFAINFKEDRRTFRKLSRKLEGLSDMVFLHDRKGIVGDAFGLEGLPFMIILDREGNVAHIHTGYADSVVDTLVDELNTLLASQ